MDIMQTAKSLVDSGALAITIAAIIFLWREVQSSHQAHLNDLREIAGLRRSLQSPHLEAATPPLGTAASSPDAI